MSPLGDHLLLFKLFEPLLAALRLVVSQHGIGIKEVGVALLPELQAEVDIALAILQVELVKAADLEKLSL